MTPQGILLLGGTGFVGRSIAARLSRKFPDVYTIARNSYAWKGLPDVQSFESSLDNSDLLKKILPRCKIVFHLASETTPGGSALQPSFEAASNLLPSLRFLEYLQEYPHIQLIYVSSGGAVYGDSIHSPVAEDEALSPLSYYGAGKAALEKFILAFCRQTKGQAIILRPSNFYGPGQPYQKGFGVVPTIFHHMLTGKPIQIWGDGKTVRDYLYIDDFVDFCIQLLEYFSAEGRSEIYNIGSGHGTTLNELCLLAEEISGKRIVREYQPARTVDVKSIVLDCSRIQRDYRWNARTDLRTGLTKAWEWFCTHQKNM